VAFQRLLNFVGRNLPKTAAEVAPGTLLSAGFGLLEGPTAAVAYGLGDIAGSVPAVLAAKALGSRIKNPVLGMKPETVRGGLEAGANIAGSLGGTMLTANMLYGNQYTQTPQVQQQIEQRALVNNAPLQAQLVSPGTQFQMAGLPDASQFEQLLNQRGNWTQYLSPEDQALLSGVISPRL
jgi:hypothetical protein